MQWVLILSFHISAWYSRLHHAGHPIQVERGAQLCGRVERSVSAAIQGAGPSAASHGDFSYDRYTAPMKHSTICRKKPIVAAFSFLRNSHLHAFASARHPPNHQLLSFGDLVKLNRYLTSICPIFFYYADHIHQIY